MKRKFTYKKKDNSYSAVAEEYFFPMGKAVKIDIYKKDGEVRNRIKFVCQPEFESFSKYQDLEISELFEIAIKRICSGKYDDFIDKAKEENIELLLRFNEGGKPRKLKGDAS